MILQNNSKELSIDCISFIESKVVYIEKTIFFIIAIVLFFAIIGIIHYKTFVVKNETSVENDVFIPKQENIVNKTRLDSDIVEIAIESVRGITQKEAELLCYSVMGEKDKDTGFIFSFSTSGAVEKDAKQYYVIRASWLVNNSHLSYIGDFFVSADGKMIYEGIAQPGEYKMSSVIWSE